MHTFCPAARRSPRCQNTILAGSYAVFSPTLESGVSSGAARSGRGLSAPARPAAPPPAAASCPPAPGPGLTTPPPPAVAAVALSSSSGPACPTLPHRVVAVVVVVVAAAAGPPRAGSRWRERPSSSATPQSPAPPGKYFICHE